ncbi:MAG TPA: DNA polymerase III subunit beta [Candidatus Saccharibacteria bacterium]|nr:DNA polymerase III subunit beta [Candidatus Saccharibacteria bacterium]
MEVIVTQENLSFALNNTSRVTSTKAGLPILGNILLRTDKSRLLVAATNLEVAASHRIGAKVTKPGSITIPARLLNEFIQNLPKEQLTLTAKDNKLHISSSTSSSTINGSPDDEFPELPTIDDKKAVKYTITASDFKQSVSQTIIAASGDSTRPILTGVYWHSFEKKLYLAATDGYRLAERHITGTSSSVNAVIPTSTLQEVLRTLRDETVELDVLFDETQVTFRLDEVEITSRLIDGNFPDYRQLIPAASETNFTINRTELIRVIKIASLFARESGGGIILNVDSDKNTLTINSIASEIGENSSEIPVVSSGQAASVSLNSRYLLDALNVMSSDEISFGFSGKLAPCVIHEITKSPAYKHIIMPLKS